MENKDNKRKWYKPASNYTKKSKYSLEVGLSGFLCTCNFREKECVRDAYRLLEEYYDDMNESVDEESDVKDDDAAEKKCTSVKTFQYLETGAKNVIFMSAKVPDPLELGLKIIKDIAETKQQKSRFLLRFVPIQVVSKAYMNDIKAKASDLFEKYFAQEPKTFSIIFNRRYNNTIQRNDLIEELAAIIIEKNPGNKADLKNPELAVIVEIIKSWCFLAVAPNYLKYKKYNLFELCNENKEKEEKVGAEPDADEKDQDEDEEADEEINEENPEAKTLCDESKEKEDKAEAELNATEKNDKSQ